MFASMSRLPRQQGRVMLRESRCRADQVATVCGKSSIVKQKSVFNDERYGGGLSLFYTSE
jgi:hypothetical protein